MSVSIRSCIRIFIIVTLIIPLFSFASVIKAETDYSEMPVIYNYEDPITGELLQSTEVPIDNRFDDDDASPTPPSQDDLFCADQVTAKTYVNIGSYNTDAVPGDTIAILGSIHNNNTIPLVNAVVRVKIFNVQKATDEIQDNLYLIDSFVVKDAISLAAGTVQNDVLFKWDVPTDAPNGQYRAMFFVTTDDMLDLSGSYLANANVGEMLFSVHNGSVLKSTLKPFVSNATDEVLRITAPSISSYPLKTGEENLLFSCVQRLFDENRTGSIDAKLVLTLKDVAGDVIYSTEYAGIRDEWTKLVKGSFVPSKNYDSFSIEAQLYNNGVLVKNEVMKYDCHALGTCSATNEPEPTIENLDSQNPNLTKMWLLVAEGFLLIVIVCAIFMILKSQMGDKKKNILGIVFAIIGVVVLLSFVHGVLAAPYTYDYRVTAQGRSQAGVCNNAFAGTNVYIGNYNRCVLISATDYDPYGLYPLGGDSEDMRSCGVFGTFGGAWYVSIADEGRRIPFNCGMLCSSDSPSGTVSGTGALCKSGGRNGVMDWNGRCCTGTQVIGACGHNNYGWYSSDISCGVPDAMVCPDTTISNCKLTPANPGDTKTGSCVSGYSGACSYTCGKEANWGGPASNSCILMPQCSNVINDDGDGLIDMADPGCTSGSDNSEADPSIVVGSISGPNCFIPVNGTSCMTTVSWSIANANTPSIKQGGIEFSTAASASVSRPINYVSAGNVNLITFNDNVGLLGSIEPKALCSLGTSWNGVKCSAIPACNDGFDNTGTQDPEDLLIDMADIGCINSLDTDETNPTVGPTLTANPRTVKEGTNSVITWYTNGANEALCTLTGGGLVTNPMATDGGDPEHGSYTATITGRTKFTVKCASFETSVDIDVVGTRYES